MSADDDRAEFSRFRAAGCGGVCRLGGGESATELAAGALVRRAGRALSAEEARAEFSRVSAAGGEADCFGGVLENA